MAKLRAKKLNLNWYMSRCYENIFQRKSNISSFNICKNIIWLLKEQNLTARNFVSRYAINKMAKLTVQNRTLVRHPVLWRYNPMKKQPFFLEINVKIFFGLRKQRTLRALYASVTELKNPYNWNCMTHLPSDGPDTELRIALSKFVVWVAQKYFTCTLRSLRRNVALSLGYIFITLDDEPKCDFIDF